VARYRFRFLLQEFDLPSVETLIGRGPDCRITMVDPLVSRHHARVRFEAGRPIFEDLGSRNGSRINGRLVRGIHALKDGDRVRIGTQELVFSEVGAVPLAALDKQTGLLRHCADCHLAYPEEMSPCPSCGSTRVEEENTLSGILDDRGRQNWALQMLIEMLRKALTLGREGDAERILVQAAASVDERIRSPNPIDVEQLETLSVEVARLSKLQSKPKWAKWMLEVYRRAAHVPPPTVVTALGELAPEHVRTLVDTVQSLVDLAPVSKLSPVELQGLDELKALVANVRER
jgi:hypothetical protein